jgi:hypothetical protein
MQSHIKDYLPDKEPLNNECLVQAKVPKKLRDETFKILKARHLTWNDLVCAAMKQLIAWEDHLKGK